jgi:hypothetical protein
MGRKKGFVCNSKIRARMSAARKGIPLSKEHCRKISENHADVSGEKHPLFGTHRSEETKRKQSISGSHPKSIPRTKEHNQKIGIANTGKKKGPLSEITKQKLRDSRKGKKRKPISDEQKRKISENRKGIPLSEDTKRKMSESQKGNKNRLGKKHTEITKKKMCGRVGNKGEKHPNWKGGISFEPYCPKFTKEFKERVRAFFGYQCVECGHIWEEDEKKLAVHHVNFDKQSCCNTSVPLFVPLCHCCHMKTNGNRVFWQYWFTEMIERLYGGKCYFSQEEMLNQ